MELQLDLVRFCYLCNLIFDFLTLKKKSFAVKEENYFEWEAAITGPEGTVFEDGVFVARLMFPQDYPLNPPTMRFTSKIFHPNIYPDGRVCISILHPPGDDPLGYEKRYYSKVFTFQILYI